MNELAGLVCPRYTSGSCFFNNAMGSFGKKILDYRATKTIQIINKEFFLIERKSRGIRTLKKFDICMGFHWHETGGETFLRSWNFQVRCFTHPQRGNW